jgi:hypothetical protein
MRFALAHMSCAGAWAWGGVPDRLRAEGHDVDAPDFDLRAGVTPADHAAQFTGRADVVAGHSYGGLVAPIAAERLGAAAVVIVDGFLVDDGESAESVHPERVAPRQAEAAERGDGMWTAGGGQVHTSHNLVPMPVSCFEAPVRFGGLPGHRVFVECLRSDFAAQAQRARDRGWTVLQRDAEHLLPLVDPAYTAKVLLDAADAVRPRR